ncbi:MAG: 4Fe-4S dicluster domain-containing protein [Thaumarchaeota archaeon]|nr:4Fe-4S dicluster domain-containing protein [Nitrososphaerota archaeon]
MARLEKKLSAEAYAELQECVHCGFCLPNCPTYRLLGVEADSPRGRIRLMKAYADGEIGITEGLVKHLSLCLVCRNCETVCPSGVEFGLAMDDARYQIEKNTKRSISKRMTRWLLLSFTFSSLSRVRFVLGLSKLPGSGYLMKKLELASFIKPMQSLNRQDYVNPSKKSVYPAEGKSRYKVAMLAGCIMSTVLSKIDRATIRVLNKNGCDIVLPTQQKCCGALHQHEGALDRTLELAKKNIKAFSKYDFDMLIVNSAGCGATMKEYGRLFASDSRWREEAKKFSTKVKDLSEFLAEIPINDNFGEVKLKIAYQDPCHLAHGQRIKKEPRKILQMIPGLTLVELKTPDQCCGAAGIYSMLYPEMAERILEARMQEISATGASAIVASNPPCYIQYSGTNSIRVYHIAELLDMSYRNFSGSSSA